MKRRTLIAAIVLALVTATAHAATGPRCEIVMVDGMRITFTNANGGLTITTGPGFERRYTWAGDSRIVEMWARKRRWYGSLGLYNPGAFIPGKLEPWKEHDGIKRFVVEEGQRHFTTVDDALQWVRKKGGPLDYIYNDRGLVVGMAKSLPSAQSQAQGIPGTLSADVWQIYINGHKPTTLEGSKNSAITVYYPPQYDLETVRPPAVPVDHDYCPIDALPNVK